MRLSESNPIICRNSVTSDKSGSPSVTSPLTFATPQSSFVDISHPLHVSLSFPTCLHSTSITFRYHSALSRTLQPTATAQLTSSATKDMLCVSGSTQSPIPSIAEHSPHVTTLSTCLDLRTLMCTKSWKFIQDTLRILCRASSQNCEKPLLASCLLSVRLSVRMEQLGSHWTDFHEIWCLNAFYSKICR